MSVIQNQTTSGNRHRRVTILSLSFLWCHFLSDHERHPLVRDGAQAFRPELCCDGAVRVGQQREAEAVLVVEGALPIHRIGADSHSPGTEFLELGGQVTEMTALLRSTGGHGLGVEEQHDRSRLDQIGQGDGGAVLVGGREFRHLVADVHRSSS